MTHAQRFTEVTSGVPVEQSEFQAAPVVLNGDAGAGGGQGASDAALALGLVDEEVIDVEAGPSFRGGVVAQVE
ncbi:MAG: hypothetical protein DK306_000592 [Chloroflexi bacterium]|nr:MAG: hypothetical protein DK306_000592 [Chloroflexota bacterium]